MENKNWVMSSSSLFLSSKLAHSKAAEEITSEVHGFVIRTSLSISHAIGL